MNSPRRPKERMRLWVDPPYRDETWLSFLDRAAQFHGIHRTHLMSAIDPDFRVSKRNRDLDRRPNERLRTCIFDALGTRDEEHELLRGIGFSWVLNPVARRTYCPRCAASDLAEGAVPFFRWQWALALTTVCHIHKTPLMMWPPCLQTLSLRWPIRWLRNNTPEGRQSVDWLDADLRKLDAHEAGDATDTEIVEMLNRIQAPGVELETFRMRDGQRSPAGFEPFMLDALISLLTGLPEYGGCRPFSEQLRPACSHEWMFSSCPRGIEPRLARDALDAFPACRDVGWRRSVLWFAARVLLGGMREVPMLDGSTLPAGDWREPWRLAVAPKACSWNATEVHQVGNWLAKTASFAGSPPAG